MASEAEQRSTSSTPMTAKGDRVQSREVCMTFPAMAVDELGILGNTMNLDPHLIALNETVAK